MSYAESKENIFGQVSGPDPELQKLLTNDPPPRELRVGSKPEPIAYVGDKPTQFIRKFETGATRDADDNKYDYEAFFCPLVLERRAAYMHKHRLQTDGSLRPGDNWQKGIPLDQYAKSEARHHMQFWKLHRGLPTVDEKGQPVDLEEAICAEMFNLEGYLHEILKAKNKS